jgi:glyoxylase-like metal-dependent hydrolase (beta-lactamase superfamily II)
MADFRPGVAVTLTATQVPVKRILGRNPSAMTGPGTNSYLIGTQQLSLLDPGPKDDAQFDGFMAAIGTASLEYILITHTHGDHSPGAERLRQATGAEVVGLPAPDVPGHDKSVILARQWNHGDVVRTAEYSLQLIHTPGHVSNHICYLLEEDELLFTGDHVLEGTTSVILPPDGDMGAYLDSLRTLQKLSLRYFAPGHGDIMDDPQAELRKLVAHRLGREKKIVARLQLLGPCHLDQLVLEVYDDVASHLIVWAKKTLLAHLIKLKRDGRVSLQGENWQLL